MWFISCAVVHSNPQNVYLKCFVLENRVCRSLFPNPSGLFLCIVLECAEWNQSYLVHNIPLQWPLLTLERLPLAGDSVASWNYSLGKVIFSWNSHTIIPLSIVPRFPTSKIIIIIIMCWCYCVHNMRVKEWSGSCRQSSLWEVKVVFWASATVHSWNSANIMKHQNYPKSDHHSLAPSLSLLSTILS